jgi:DNA-directed RNA polymerase specialized sigma24 family protein
MLVSGSIENIKSENTKRLGVLHTKHHEWLMACSYNKTKDVQLAQDLVQDLYVYLGEKCNPKLFYRDSFNLLYCHNFLSSRYINWIKRESKNNYPTRWKDKEDKPYDIDSDVRIQNAYDNLKGELKRLEKTRMWSSAKLYELYAFSEMTMEELSNNIGISKSTTFLNIKKIKEHLKTIIDNPFDNEQTID